MYEVMLCGFIIYRTDNYLDALAYMRAANDDMKPVKLLKDGKEIKLCL